jgi:hypothetical protein
MAYLAKKGERYYICESYQVVKHLTIKSCQSEDTECKIIRRIKLNGYYPSKNLLKWSLGKIY